MFLKYKAKKAVKKLISGAPNKEVKSAVSSVVSEATRQFFRKMEKLQSRMPVKVSISPR